MCLTDPTELLPKALTLGLLVGFRETGHGFLSSQKWFSFRVSQFFGGEKPLEIKFYVD